MISHCAEYALRAVICLAGHSGQYMTVREIAEEAGVRVPYLGKILSSVARAGFISSQRGVKGGYILSRPAHEITLLDLIRAADPSHGATTRFAGDVFASAELRALFRRLTQASSRAEYTLCHDTVADVLADADRFRRIQAAGGSTFPPSPAG